MSCTMPVINGIKPYCDCRDNIDDMECVTSGWKKVANNRTVRREF